MLASRKLDPRILPRLNHVIREGGFDLIDTQNVQAQLWGTLAAWRNSLTLVSTLNSWYADEYSGPKAHLYDAIVRATVRRVDLFIAVSPEIEANLRERHVPADNIAVIPNAVSIRPDEVIVDRASLRRDLGLPADASICCAVGRLVEAKGYDRLIAVMEGLSQRYPALHCLVIGDGPLRRSLAESIRRRGLVGRVRLLGYRPPDEVLRLVKAADVFVMPSRTEGTPMALLEAAVLGTPIVANAVGGIPAVLTHERHALLVEPGRDQALADALARVLDRREEAARLGAAARDHLERAFGAAAQAAAMAEAYCRARDHARARRGH